MSLIHNENFKWFLVRDNFLSPKECDEQIQLFDESKKDVSNDVISGNMLFPTASITHGNFFCNFATGPNIAVCAAVPAFFAILVLFVAARVKV